MNPEREGAPDPGEEQGSLPLLVLLACVVGAGAGAIGTLFRLCLEHADAWRDALIGWAHVAPIVGFVLVTAGCASAVALAAWLAAEFLTSRRYCARMCRPRP
jgi:CIC family chloride channel protein